MITIKEFMISEKPKRISKLEPFKNDILTLKNEGYSVASIVRYLAMNEVSITPRGLSLFIQNNIDAKASDVDVVEKVSEGKNINTASTGEKPRKFDWQAPIDETDLI